MDLFGLFGTAIKIITNWGVFVKTVMTAVIAAEADQNATGDQKRAAVIKVVLDSMKTDFGIDLTGFEAVITTVINLIVAVFNELGVFQHKAKS